MNQKNEEYLFERYPVLYQGHRWPITTNLLPFGIETGNGWFRLIDQLSSDITELDKREGSQTIAVQVKEKFGGLRFYIEGGTDAVMEAIDKAEEESLKTCELCGEPGSLRGVGWVSTMCDKCWAGVQEKEGVTR